MTAVLSHNDAAGEGYSKQRCHEKEDTEVRKSRRRDRWQELGAELYTPVLTCGSQTLEPHNRVFLERGLSGHK